jgi:hypothetical protein
MAVSRRNRENEGVPLLLILVTCALLLLFVRRGGGRYYGIFRYRDGLRSPGNDGLGQARGVQEEDTVTPWRPPERPSEGDDAAG